MKPEQILLTCRNRRIKLTVAGNNLRFTAPHGSLTPDLRNDIAIHKEELLALLSPAKNTKPVVSSCVLVALTQHRIHTLQEYPIKLLEPPLPVVRRKKEFPKAKILRGHKRIELNWDGNPLVGPYIALDTETAIPDDPDDDRTIQRLVLMSVTDGRRTVILAPDQVGDFLLAHADKVVIFFNVKFDFWVLHETLKEQKDCDGVELLWHMAGNGQLRDAMLLDTLRRLMITGDVKIEGKKGWPYRSLEAVAAEFVGIELKKNENDRYRKHYAALRNVPLTEVQDRGWFDYTAVDTEATLQVYATLHKMITEDLQRHETLMPGIVRRCERWGLLSEYIQVMGAIALDDLNRHGVQIDTARQQQVRGRLQQELNDAVVRINDVVNNEAPCRALLDGENSLFMVDTDGSVHKSIGVLRNILEEVVIPRLEQKLGKYVALSRTIKTNSLSVSKEEWAAYAPHDEFVQLWLTIEEKSKRLQFVKDTPGIVYPHYQLLVSTGRTSCRDPNIQQLPRTSGIREMVIPPTGNVLMGADYNCLELRTLAQVCLNRYGKSSLADVFARGVDVHAMTAADFLGLRYDEFLQLKKTDPERYKQARQQAKAVNFGVPGGLGATTLVEYAQKTYGVVLSVEEANQLRQQLITKTYPELSSYLADNTMAGLAWNFNTTEDFVWDSLSWEGPGTRSPHVPGYYRRILRGEMGKAGGEPYSDSSLAAAWERLQLAAIKNPSLCAKLNGTGNDDLLAECVKLPAYTLTGRIRGRCGYTQQRNTPFQGLAADGAKLALFELVRRGWEVAIFVHDEIIVAIPEDRSDYEKLGAELTVIMEKAMERVAPDVRIEVGEAVPMCRWSKDAKILRDKQGRIIPWSD